MHWFSGSSWMWTIWKTWVDLYIDRMTHYQSEDGLAIWVVPLHTPARVAAAFAEMKG